MHGISLLALLLMGSATLVLSDDPTGYIEYFPGTLPIILSAPHGGYLSPINIPDRGVGCYVNGKCVWRHDCGGKNREKCKSTTVTDMYTANLTAELRKELYTRFGEYPYVVINKLRRIKMDANRDIDEATFGDPTATKAWTEYQKAINDSKAAIELEGPGLFLDIHGHGKKRQWAMLGYLIRGSNLDSGDFTAEQTSIRALLGRYDSGQMDNILRGATSFGRYLEDSGFDAVPSPANPEPNGAFYYSGGYNTRMHGSRSGGKIDAIQIESPRTFRDENFSAYVKGLGTAIEKFMATHYNVTTEKSMHETQRREMVKSHVEKLAPRVLLIASIVSVLFVLLN